LSLHPTSVALKAGNTYTLTWNTGEMKNGDDITVTVANVTDLAGNVVGSPSSGTHAGGGIGIPPAITSTGTATSGEHHRRADGGRDRGR